MKKFGIAKCNPLSTPIEQNMKLTYKEEMNFRMQLSKDKFVGTHVYLTTTKPDISSFVGILSRLMKKTLSRTFLYSKKSSKILERNSRLWTQIFIGG